MSDSLRLHTVHRASLSFTVSLSLLKHLPIESVMSANNLIFCCPRLLLPSIFPSIKVLSNELVLHIRLAKVSELQLQYQSFQWIYRVDFLKDWIISSPCCPRDSQEFSLGPQFESIISLVLSLLYGPAVTCDYWQNHSIDQMDLLGKMMSLLFNTLSRFNVAFFPRSFLKKLWGV